MEVELRATQVQELQAQNNGLAQQNPGDVPKLDALQEELNDAKALANAYQADRDEFMKQNDELNDTVKQLKDRVAVLEGGAREAALSANRATQLEKENKDLKAKLSAAQRRVEELEKRAQSPAPQSNGSLSSPGDAARLQTQVTIQQKDIHDLKNEVKTKASDIASLKEEKENLLKQTLELQDQCSNLERRLADMEHAKNNAARNYEDEIRALNRVVAEFEAHAEHSFTPDSDAVSKLEATVAELRDQLGAEKAIVKDLREQLRLLKNAATDPKVHEMEQQIARLEEALQEQQEKRREDQRNTEILRDQVAQLASERDSMRHSHDSLKQQLTLVKKAEHGKDSLRQLLNDKNQALARAEARLLEANKKLKALQASSDDKEEASEFAEHEKLGEIEELKNQVKSLEAELSHTEAAHHRALGTIEELTAEVQKIELQLQEERSGHEKTRKETSQAHAELQATVSELEDQLEAQTTEKESALERNIELQEEAQELRTQVGQLQNTKENLEQSLAELEAEAADLRKRPSLEEYTALKTELKEMQTNSIDKEEASDFAEHERLGEIEELQSQVRTLETDLSHSEAAHHRALGTIEELKEEVQGLARKLEGERTEHSETREQLKRVELERSEAITPSHSAVHAEARELREELRRLETQLAATEAERDREKGLIAELREELDGAWARLGVLKEEKKELEEQLADAHKGAIGSARHSQAQLQNGWKAQQVEYESTLTRLRNQERHDKGLIEELQEQLAALRQELKAPTDTGPDTTELIAQLQKQVEMLEDELRLLKADNSQLIESEKKLQGKLEKLKQGGGGAKTQMVAAPKPMHALSTSFDGAWAVSTQILQDNQHERRIQQLQEQLDDAKYEVCDTWAPVTRSMVSPNNPF